MFQAHRARRRPVYSIPTDSRRLLLTILEDRCTPAITGTVFQDFNANGAFDTTYNPLAPTAIDRGMPGVSVTAFNAGNQAVGNAVSDALGNYVLNAGGSGPFRVEFTNLPSGVYFGPQGTNNGSAIQFVNGNAA